MYRFLVVVVIGVVLFVVVSYVGFRGKFAVLENISCKIKPGCKAHPPWPVGTCFKCQPRAVTLQRQVTTTCCSCCSSNCKAHLPWPVGICTKCQLYAVTLQRQVTNTCCSYSCCCFSSCSKDGSCKQVSYGTFKVPWSKN